MSAPAQRSFAGGELAPALYARTDQVKYATGLRTCRNMFVRRHGGAANRPGTQFIAETKNSALACRLIRFVRDSTSIGDTYVIELGAGYARFFQNGGAIVTSGVAAWVTATAYAVGDLVTQGGVTYYCTLAHVSAAGTDKPGVDAGAPAKWYAQVGTLYEIPTPYQTADLADLQVAQAGDVITIVHPSYAPRELKRYAHTRWTLTSIVFGPSIAAPTNVAASYAGGATVGTEYYAVTAIKETTLEESLPGLLTATHLTDATHATTLTWDTVPGAVAYNVYRSTDGKTFGFLARSGGSVFVDTTDAAWTTVSSTANSVVPGVFTAAPDQCRNPLAAISATVRAFDGNYTVTVTGELQTGHGSVGDASGRLRVYYSRNGEPRILGGTSDYLTLTDGDGTLDGAFAITINVPDNGYTTLTIDVVAEAMCAPGAGSTATMIASATGAVAWKGGVNGVVDANLVPDFSIGPPTEPTLFVAGGYPAATTNFQQRRLFGNTAPDPDKVWASRIGSYASFAASTPLQDDDLVAFAIAGQSTNVVKHLMDLGRLLVFTTGGVFLCGDDSGVMTPTTPNPRSIAHQGTGRLRPLAVDDSAIFLQARGTIVRDLQPFQSGGALGGYAGKDLTVFAAHLVDGYTIADWAYAETPHSIVWAVRSDGTLLGLTYLREHAIWGWHRHDTDGAFENVLAVPEGSEDAIYVIVRRTVQGVTKRYLERFVSRFFTRPQDAIFVDAALSYDGTNTTARTMTLTGGVAWTSVEQLVVTAGGGTPFIATNVGDSVVFTANDGTRVEVVLEVFTDSSHMKGRPTRTIPVELQGVATATWTLAVAKVGGLSHLEGKAVSVLGDGFVVASPNNASYAPVVVAGGIATFARAYGVIHVGVPFISDLETLDLDSPGPRTIKDKKSIVNKVALYVEASRGIWAGRPDKVTAGAPLAGLQERKARQLENYQDPPAAFTGYLEIAIDDHWDNNGGILVRQVDPLPLTVLAAMPIGNIPGA